MRWYHDGDLGLNPTLVDVPGKGLCAQMPRAYWQKDLLGSRVPTYVPAKPGSILLSTGTSFYVVPPGGHIDLPDDLTRDAVRALSGGHLLTEAEARALGLVKQGE